MTAGPETCPLCGRPSLADRGDEGIVCEGCGSAFAVDHAVRLIRYWVVGPAYAPLNTWLTEGWRKPAEIRQEAGALAFRRSRAIVLGAAAAIAVIALFACALSSAIVLAPAVRASQGRIAAANPPITGTLGLTPTLTQTGVALSVTVTPVPSPPPAQPTRSSAPTAGGPLISPLPKPAATPTSVRPTAVAPNPTPPPVATPTQELARPTQRPTTPAEPTIVLPPTFTPVATPTALATGEAVFTPTASPTSTATPTSTPSQAQPTSLPSATATPAAGTVTAVASATTDTSGIPPSPLAGTVNIRTVNYAGTIDLNEADEFVELANTGTVNVQMQGWTIRRRSTATFQVMPSLTLLAGQICRIYTDSPTNYGDCGAVSFYSQSALWRNDRDTLELLDSLFRLVAVYTYSAP